MFIGVETDERGKAFDMSFRSIGELSRNVIAEADLRAARQATAANESGAPSVGRTDGAPDAQASGGDEASELRKDRGRAPAVEGRVGRYQRRNVKLMSTPAHLVLVVSNGWRRDNRRQHGAHPAPALRRPLLIAVGGHASMPSGTF